MCKCNFNLIFLCLCIMVVSTQAYAQEHAQEHTQEYTSSSVKSTGCFIYRFQEKDLHKQFIPIRDSNYLYIYTHNQGQAQGKIHTKIKLDQPDKKANVFYNISRYNLDNDMHFEVIEQCIYDNAEISRFRIFDDNGEILFSSCGEVTLFTKYGDPVIIISTGNKEYDYLWSRIYTAKKRRFKRIKRVINTVRHAFFSRIYTYAYKGKSFIDYAMKRKYKNAKWHFVRKETYYFSQDIKDVF